MSDDKNNVITTKIVEEIKYKENMGMKLKKHEKLWFTNIHGIRKANITFAMTPEEVQEYFKSKISVHHFAQEYCQIKREDGTIGKMTLRDYQKDIIDLYTKNRFSILMASRQTGKCNSFCVKVCCKTTNGDAIIKTLGELYFEELKKERKLTIYEKMKYILYNYYNILST